MGGARVQGGHHGTAVKVQVRKRASPLRAWRGCLTKEKLEKELFADEKDNARCKHVVVSSSRTVRQERMECTGDEKLSGEMRFEALSREKVNGIIKMSVGEGPRTMTVNSTMAARWIGADCGDRR